MEAKSNKIIFLVSCSILMLSILIFISYYKAIPDIIPIHKNFNGEVDNYGSKNLTWLTFLINALILGWIGYLINKPHVLNYPVEITEENIIGVYGKMQAFLAYLAVIVSIIFAAITFSFADILNKGNYIYILALYLTIILLPILTTKFLSKRS
jgi:uncharacterized membrane protein